MSDETKAPGEGEGGGLPPKVEAMASLMSDPKWKERLTELEVAVHAAIQAVFDHAGPEASAISIPVKLPDGSVRTVMAGLPEALFETLRAEGPRVLVNKHVIIMHNFDPRELFLGTLMSMLRDRASGGDDEEDDEDDTPTPGCECPRCERLRAAAKENKQH